MRLSGVLSFVIKVYAVLWVSIGSLGRLADV